MIELVTFVALLSLMMYAVCLIVLLVVHVEAGGQIKVCAQGYLGCTAVDWRNHTCLKWSDKKVKAQMVKDDFTLNGTHSNYCRNLTKVNRESSAKAKCYVSETEDETMVTYSPCEPANCYATLQQDPLCWVQATVTEGDLLMLDCTRDTQRVGWSTPGADCYLLVNGSLLISSLTLSHSGEYNCSMMHWYNVTVVEREVIPAQQKGPRKRYNPDNVCSNKRGLCEVGAVFLLGVSILAGLVIGSRGIKGLVCQRMRSFNLRDYFARHDEQKVDREVYTKKEDRLIPSIVWQFDALQNDHAVADQVVAGRERTMCYENHLTILRSQLEPSLKRGGEVQGGEVRGGEVRGGEVRGGEEGSEVGTISGVEVYFSDSFEDGYGVPESV